jgi:hypothetical protein
MNKALDEFVASLRKQCAQAPIAVRRWPGSHHPSLSVLEFVGDSSRALAYIKVRNSRRGFWGINPNQLGAIRASGHPWCVVLLHGTEQTGFFLTAQHVEQAIDVVWHAGHDTEFKVNENTVTPLSPSAGYEQLHARLIDLLQHAE